jgi:hypothetical protein
LFSIRLKLSTLLVSLMPFSATVGQEQFVAMPEEELKIAVENLQKTLAGPKEEAYLQVLVDAKIVYNPYADTASTYDLVVRYDPARYRNDRVGVYPITFEDQFILWGKRISLFTRSTTWESGSFYLRNIGTAREAWIATEDCRRLYQPRTKNLPPIGHDPATFRRWLRLIYNIEPGTELRAMSRWLQLLKEEPRVRTIERLRQARSAVQASSTEH